MDDRFPLRYQIICMVLTALFVWVFSIAREPRRWRRLFQSTFSRNGTISVNRNKVIDEHLKRYGIVVAMLILVIDVGFFIAGVTHRHRAQVQQLSPEALNLLQEQKRIKGAAPAESRRAALP